MQKILTLIDFTTESEHTANWALEIAHRSHSDVVLYHSYPSPHLIPEAKPAYPDYADQFSVEKEAFEKLGEFASRLKKRDDQNTLTYFNGQGTLEDHIREVLRRQRSVWLIVMGDLKRTNILSRFIFGSDTYSVISLADCPVLMVPPGSRPHAIEKIAFASDLEKADYGALRRLTSFAGFFKARIIVIPVYPRWLAPDKKIQQTEDYVKILRKVKYPYITFEGFTSDGEGISQGLIPFLRKTKPDILAIVNHHHPFYEQILHHSATEIPDYQQLPVLILPAESMDNHKP